MEQDPRRHSVEQAYRDHADDVFRVAYAILHDQEAAADVTQEVFARAFDRWSSYDSTQPLRPWLHAIAAHLALDGLRRLRVRRLAAPRLGGSQGTLMGDPSSQVLARLAIEEALAGLPARARAALVLRHYYGYDQAAIAALLHTSPGNVAVLLSRARQALRAAGSTQPARAQDMLSGPDSEAL